MDRNPERLLSTTVHEISTECEILNKRTAGQLYWQPSAMDVTFRSEPGEGVGVRRSFFTAIAEVCVWCVCVCVWCVCVVCVCVCVFVFVCVCVCVVCVCVVCVCVCVCVCACVCVCVFHAPTCLSVYNAYKHHTYVGQWDE